MFNIVLFEPEIPPNTGNIIRLASNSGCSLHLLEPLAFDLDDKKLRRAGLDYHEFSGLQVHKNWKAFLSTLSEGARIFACTTKGDTAYTAPNYQMGDYLLFGPETRGLPEEIRNSKEISQRIRIPMKAESRSLNLSNSVSIIVFEAWRQMNFAGSE